MSMVFSGEIPLSSRIHQPAISEISRLLVRRDRHHRSGRNASLRAQDLAAMLTGYAYGMGDVQQQYPLVV